MYLSALVSIYLGSAGMFVGFGAIYFTWESDDILVVLSLRGRILQHCFLADVLKPFTTTTTLEVISLMYFINDSLPRLPRLCGRGYHQISCFGSIFFSISGFSLCTPSFTVHRFSMNYLECASTNVANMFSLSLTTISGIKQSS